MTRRLALCALPLLVVAVVACGGDDKSSRAATAVEGDVFCTTAAEVDTLTDSLGGALSSGDPAQFKAALNAVISAAESAEKVAPTDIVQKVTISIDGFKKLRSGLEEFDYDFDAAAADPEFAALLDNAELEANGEAVDAYLEAKCGIAAG